MARLEDLRPGSQIRLAHLSDPMLAVHTSLIEPLPHQKTELYGDMLHQQPLRFLFADDPVGGEVKETKRYKPGKLLSSLTRHFLLLTATPHNGKKEDFQLFMALLDGDRFEGRFRGGVHSVDVSGLMRRMVKEDLLKFDGTALSPERRAYTVNFTLTDAEGHLYKEVMEYVREEFNRADALESEGRKGTVGFALTILQRRLASSPEAIYQSVKRRRERLERRLREEELLKRGAEYQVQENELLELTADDLDIFDEATSAEVEAPMLEKRGSNDRYYQNMLLFVAPDRGRLNDLEQAIREYPAWDSIVRDALDSLNLTGFQTGQGKTQRDKADDTVRVRINETYVWLLVCTQPDPQGLNLKTLWKSVASDLYFPRLKDEDVLLQPVQDGIGQRTWSDNFAYAEAYDETKGRYLGFKYGQTCSVVMDERSVIAKPDVALKQIREEEGDRENRDAGRGRGDSGQPERDRHGPVGLSPLSGSEPKAKRFYGSVALDPLRLKRDAAAIAGEVIQHFTRLVGAEVEVVLEISVKAHDEIPEHVVRTVSENCRTLKFKSSEFEKE